MNSLLFAVSITCSPRTLETDLTLSQSSGSLSLPPTSDLDRILTCTLYLPCRDWDPTKWIIWALHTYTPFVPTIRRTKDAEIHKAKAHVHRLQAERLTALVPELEKSKEDHELPVWTSEETSSRAASGQALLLIDGYIVDVSDYLDEHVSRAGARRTGRKGVWLTMALFDSNSLADRIFSPTGPSEPRTRP